ncbi:MAG TPA: acyltransferase [Acidimicrobiia bacterium]
MNPLQKTLDSAERLAANTPEERNRYVDLLRALSILVVVFGHWLMAAPEVVNGEIRIGHVLTDIPWTRGLTWLLQVMPVFFFVGGFSNALGLRGARRKGVTYGKWLNDRLRRLIVPVLPVLALWAPAAWLAVNSGVDSELVRIGSQAALVPVWFLATYVLVVAMAPWTLALWERWGWGAFLAFAMAAAAVDVAYVGFEIDPVRWLNYVFVWNAVHILGYAWADGRIGGIGQRVMIAVGGFVTLMSLIILGPYPVSMVGFAGETITNSNPPKVTLVALAVFQFGLAMIFEAPARVWLSKLKTWTKVVAINGSIMTLYLWHLTALVAVVGILLMIGGPGLGIEVGSLLWWITRPLWLGFMVLVTIPFLIVFGRFERPRTDNRPAPPAWKPIMATLAVCAGLGLLASGGIADADGLNVVAILLPIVGMVAFGVVGAGRWEQRRERHDAQ